ncbi:MAG: hypothetical protein AAFR47_17485 [Pseudomonadota bacterium]
MEPVEETLHRGPVRIGFGTPAQKKPLLEAGAERVFTEGEIDAFLNDPVMRGMMLRPGDVIVLVQANLLTVRQMLRASAQGISFEVPGHEPRQISGEAEIREFRRLKPIGVEFERRERRGAKPKLPVPTDDQMRNIISLWQNPSMKRAEVVRRVRDMMDCAEVEFHWIRDRVKAATGSAARAPHNKES